MKTKWCIALENIDPYIDPVLGERYKFFKGERVTKDKIFIMIPYITEEEYARLFRPATKDEINGKFEWDGEQYVLKKEITMATVKSFTDLEQSRRLAEILPLESADQTWARIAIAGANLGVPEELQYRHNGDMPFQYYSGICTPCWSLAALLNALPLATLDSSNDHYYRLHFMERYTEWCDNPVDACVAMIERLNELKML